MFQSDAAHKGVVGGKHHPLLGNTTWTVKTGGKIFSSPVVLKNTVYVGSEDGYVYAIDATTGKESWKFKTQGAVHSTPALHAGNLYVGSFDGSYYCLNSKSGTEVWKFKTGGERWPGGKGYFGLKPDTMDMSDPWDYFLSSPVIVEGQEGVTVFFGSSDGNVYAVDGKTGMLRWKYHTDGIVHSSPAVSEGVLYIGGWDTYLYAINASTGKLLWKFKTGGQFAMSGIQTSPTIANGTVYFGARDASFYAVDAKTGGVKWKYDAEGSWVLSTAAYHDNTLYVGTSDTYLVLALDATTGSEKWRRKLSGYVYGSPCLTTDALFIGDFTGRVYAINPATGNINNSFETESYKANKSILKADGTMSFQDIAAGRDLSSYQVTLEVMNTLYKLGPIVSSPTVVNNTLYVGSANGSLYAISLVR
jgi:outer membrane protein assembly factor BamB